MTNLTSPHAIIYNGFRFAGPRVSTSLRITPVRDASERVVIADRVDLLVRAYVTFDENGQLGMTSQSQTTDTIVKQMQSKLLQDGKPLTVTGLGYGDVTINSDIAWGPKTTELSIKPVGREFAMEIDWAVQYQVKRCGDSYELNGQVGDLKSLSYSATYSINDRGLTSRTIAGVLEIVNASRSGDTPDQTADQYRNKMKVVVPEGFRRARQNWVLAENKSALQFTITDEELPSEHGYPPGVTSIRMSHQVSMGAKGGYRKSQQSITGSVSVAKGFPLALAWDRILLAMKSRIDKIAGNTIIVELTVNESIFDHSFSFAMSFFTMPKDTTSTKPLLGTMIKDSRLFSSFKGVLDWNTYAQAMSRTVWSDRGLAGLYFKANSDKLISVCQQGTVKVTDGTKKDLAEALGGSLANECPSKKESYIFWQQDFEILDDSGSNALREMPTGKVGTQRQVGGGPGQAIGESVEGIDNQGLNPRLKRKGKIVVQDKGQHTLTLQVTGEAIRLCFPVEIPQVLKAWGEKAELSPRTFKQKERTENLAGLLAHWRAWKASYIVAFDDEESLKKALELGIEGMTLATEDDPTGVGKIGAAKGA